MFFDRGAKPDRAQAVFRGIAHRWLTCPGIDSATLCRLMCAAYPAKARRPDLGVLAMGLTAVELRLLGKYIVAPARAADAVMRERHCVAHKGGRRVDHHESLAGQLLEWSRGRGIRPCTGTRCGNCGSRA